MGSGFSPGPLSTLAITQTLRHGPREGLKVCCAPLLADLPVIAAAIFCLSRVAGLKVALAGLSVVGAVFIFRLAYANLTFQLEADGTPKPAVVPASFRQGLAASLLSPYAFLFWTSVGAPFLSKAWASGLLGMGAFVLAFYLSVLGAKCCIVGIATRARPFLAGRGYVACIRLLGGVIALFGFKFLIDGVRALSG